MAMRMTTGADMQGWLDKRAGGKKDSLSIGKLTHHWDKRYFLLRGPLLHYYHSEAEIAHVDKSPGEVKCADVTVVPSPVKEVFALKTAERVLTLRASSAALAEEWMAAIHHAGAGMSPDSRKISVASSGSSNFFGESVREDNEFYKDADKMYDTSRSLDIITDIHDTAMHKAVRKVLGGADKIVGVQMPYTPRCLRFTQDVKLAVWDSIKWKMEESICEARSKADKTYREMRLKHWAGYPQFWPRGSCCPRPYTWFRARFLYAILPADAGRWQTLRNPKTVGIFMLSFCPFYAVSVWVFVLLFCLIDKTDEYQLSQYILKFKTTQCATAMPLPASRHCH